MTYPTEAIESLLRANWNNANTNGRSPLIDEIWDVHNPQVANNQDYVLLYEAAASFEYNTIEHQTKDNIYTVTIEIRTANRTQLKAIQAEVDRILDANNNNPGSPFTSLEIVSRRDLVQDRNKPLFIMQIDVRVYQVHQVIS